MCLCCCEPNSSDLSFKAVEFIITGAENIKYENDGRKVLVDIGQAGGELRFEASGKNAENGFIAKIKSAGMDDYRYRTNDDDTNVFPYVMMENDELKVSILSDNPHTTLVLVKENTLGGKKTHSLGFGAANFETSVIISQEGK